MKSSELGFSGLAGSSSEVDCGKRNENELLLLLRSVRVELEDVLRGVLDGGEQDPLIANIVAAKLDDSLKSLDPSEIEPNILVTILHVFLDLVSVSANLFGALKSGSSGDIEPLSNALDKCIALAERIVVSDFELNLDKRFEEIIDTVLKICRVRQPYSKRNYVALIKIHNRLLERVDEPILRQSHVAELVHNMGVEIKSSLVSDGDQNWKLVAFLVKRIAFLSSKCGFCSDEPRFIGTIAKLYELRLADHPLNRLVEKIELWTLVDFEGLEAAAASEKLGIGYVLLCCDHCESFLGSRHDGSRLGFCVREIYRHASDIVKFMFHRIGSRPVFDHCLHILCRGLVFLDSPNVLDGIDPENVSFEQRLLRDEICRYFGRIGKEIFDATFVLTAAHDRSALQSFFAKALEFAPMKIPNPSLMNRSVTPCSPNSALLFALISSIVSLDSIKVLPIQHSVSRASELVDVLSTNSGNDCLFLSACSFFSSLGECPLRDLENIAYQAPIVKLKEIVTQHSHNDMLNAFGAMSLIVFTYRTDCPGWLNLKCPSHTDYFQWFGSDFNHDRWDSTCQLLQVSQDSSIPTNFYIIPKKRARDSKVPSDFPDPQPPSIASTVHKCVTELESLSELPSAEEIQILKLCSEKLAKYLERSPYR